jgi:hypothetical protein
LQANGIAPPEASLISMPSIAPGAFNGSMHMNPVGQAVPAGAEDPPAAPPAPAVPAPPLPATAGAALPATAGAALPATAGAALPATAGAALPATAGAVLPATAGAAFPALADAMPAVPEPLAGDVTMPVAGVAPASAGAGALTPPAALALPPNGSPGETFVTPASPQPTTPNRMAPTLTKHALILVMMYDFSFVRFARKAL